MNYVCCSLIIKHEGFTRIRQNRSTVFGDPWAAPTYANLVAGRFIKDQRHGGGRGRYVRGKRDSGAGNFSHPSQEDNVHAGQTREIRIEHPILSQARNLSRPNNLGPAQQFHPGTCHQFRPGSIT